MMGSIKIGILGAGSFGTALAHIYAQKGFEVTLWGRNEALVKTINKERINHIYLKEVSLAHFKATPVLSEVCQKKEVLIFAIPSQFIRSVLDQSKKYLEDGVCLVNTAKGIENKTLKLPHQIFQDVLGKKILSTYCSISGPTFAQELILKHPSGASLSGFNEEMLEKVQHWLSTKYFRLYTHDDVIGVELGGALKNVMAIGVGIADGLGFGLNTRAGLMTRCLNEMIKLGVAMGANPLTFSGLSGLGDLILTCTGDLSRNRQVGLQLGKGKTLEEIIKGMNSVAEGIATAKSVYELSKKYRVEMPNAEYVYRILYENLPPKKALQEILSRELKEELTIS